ncbi:MAG: PPC domain-containing protein [Polyangiaceae bacterium]
MRVRKLWIAPLFVGAPLLVTSFAGCNEIVGIHEGKPPGSSVACTTVDDCPAPLVPDCSTLTACEAETCQYTNELDGKPLPVEKQIVGDCSQIVCNGEGATRLEAFDADAEEDGNPCTQDTCVGGNSIHTPQQQVDCYALPDGTPGPVGTKGVGLCHVGVQHCDANFLPIGGCEGAVFPAAETCNAPGDEDCDGQVNEDGEGCYCTPSTQDSCYAGDPAKAGVGICALGQCLCNSTGTACETACMGWVPPQVEDCSTPTDDDCDGEDVDPEDGCLCVANQTVDCYVCDATGKAYAQVPSAIDDCQIPGDDDCDGKAVDSCTGAITWVKGSTQTGPYSSATIPTALAVDDAGNVTIVGYSHVSESVNFGGGVLPNPVSAPTQYNLFVVNYSATGAHRWSKLLSCVSPQVNSYAYERPRVAIAGSNIVVAVHNSGYSCDYGSGTADSTSGTVVVRLNAATGAFVSKNNVTMPNGIVPRALAGAADGTVAIGGYASNYPALVEIDAAGTVKWAKTFSIPEYYYGYEANAVTNVAILDDLGVAFAGYVKQSGIDLGAGLVGNAYPQSTRYVGVMSAMGSLRWGVGSTKPSQQLALRPIGEDIRVVGGGAESFCDSACQAEVFLETEPNDSTGAANAIGAKRVVRGAYASSGQSDYFSITVPQGADLVLELSDSGSPTTCSGYTGLQFYGPTGTSLVTSTYGDIGNGDCGLLSNANGNPQVTNLAAGTYFIRVYPWSSPYQFAYQLNVKVNGVGATAMPTTVSNGHALMLDAADGTATALAQLPLSAIEPINAVSVDALGHTVAGAGSGSTYAVSKFNAQGVKLWNTSLPLSTAPPLVAAGADGTVYFVGTIYGTQTIGGTSLGTQSAYEMVWGKLAQ